MGKVVSSQSENSSAEVKKVGIVLCRQRAGREEEYLIYRPKPQQIEDKDKTLPFQLARGTIELKKDATHLAAAQREAKEELGLRPTPLLKEQQWVDCGLHKYKGKDGTYPIHFFALEVPRGALFHKKPEDAAAVQWATRSQIGEMAESNEFKKDYLPILDAAIAQIERQHHAKAR